MFDRGGMTERVGLDTVSGQYDPFGWKCHVRVEKWSQAGLTAGDPASEVFEHTGNIRFIGGASLFWERALTKNPSTSATGAALQALSSDNAVIGVGDSTAAAAKTQTGLQTTGTKYYTTMTTGWPTHTDASTSTGAQSAVFKGAFGTTDANISIQELVIANSSGGRHINRIVQDFGTKTTGTWTFTVTLTETT